MSLPTLTSGQARCNDMLSKMSISWPCVMYGRVRLGHVRVICLGCRSSSSAPVGRRTPATIAAVGAVSSWKSCCNSVAKVLASRI